MTEHTFRIVKPMRFIGLRVDVNPEPGTQWTTLLAREAFTECCRQTDDGMEWMILSVPLTRR